MIFVKILHIYALILARPWLGWKHISFHLYLSNTSMVLDWLSIHYLEKDLINIFYIQYLDLAYYFQTYSLFLGTCSMQGVFSKLCLLPHFILLLIVTTVIMLLPVSRFSLSWTEIFIVFDRNDLPFMQCSFEPRHDKTNKVSVCPAKTQVSLGICPVWSESSLSAWRNLGSLATQWVDSEDWSDWTDAQADLSLRWAHTHFVDFVMSRLFCLKKSHCGHW